MKIEETQRKSKSTFKNNYEPAPTTDLLLHQEREKESERQRETHFLLFSSVNFSREPNRGREREMTVGLVGSEETR